MKEYTLKFGKGYEKFVLGEETLLGVLKSNPRDGAPSEEDAIRSALENPIASERLKDKVSPGEKVCIVICDITRAWQHTASYLPLLVEEIKAGGVEESDIFFLSATGTHRKQTEEEHSVLLGKLAGRFKVIDHISQDEESLEYVGTTSFGTPVKLNKSALEADHIVITGGIVYHFMAGWGGGRKAILPGIAGHETIMKNHALALKPLPDSGRNESCRSGNLEGNVIHMDMVEAASMVNPTFALNVILDGQGNIAWAVAGNWKEAHLEGTRIVDEVDRISITEKADLVVASAGGFPKDINLYQTSKTIINGLEAVKPGGTMIVLSACSEGFGHPEVRSMLMDFPDQNAREAELRRAFSIAKFVGYVIAEAALTCRFILVTEINQEELQGTGIIAVRSLEEGLSKAKPGEIRKPTAWLMPMGANTLPQLRI
ncbi:MULTISPECIES: nickel-dependent lactate racemase [Dethiosulfovibrio]|uniref:Nickel-dependent lactate racemase n=2 Tax=Dethiosulfovibrio TaxID=47054 RepID=A0ABS9ENV6_9BACT|nr:MULTISPECIES: nickel-dependent lactate racemase [Dethiosulfovibrio]MCF4114640.1 nickel-dependent lactate racemase [Dethiosulfovibrio russensis]MCF4142864.1 nickel-dependent lactate racemase [Dethiosulfovibrio marinus]MCF4144807.1 nickel-dependent lactate racemase [Dethiosulfovibrio acidaminovorans]